MGECICFDYKSDEASPERLFPPPGGSKWLARTMDAWAPTRMPWAPPERVDRSGPRAALPQILQPRRDGRDHAGEPAVARRLHECRYRLITKLDGSLASPLLLHAASADAPSSVTTTGSPVLIWATRKHEAPTIAAFVSSHDASHAEGRAQYIVRLRWAR